MYSNLESCVRWLQKILNPNCEIILNQASFSFDLSVADTYLALVNGKTHYMIEDDLKMNFVKLFGKLAESKAELAVMTPSFAEMLLIDKSFGEEIMPNLKQILFCGEKLQWKTIEKLKNRFENIEIINSYGPTESTFAVTSITLNDEVIKTDFVPIGYEKSDVKLFIVDDNLNILEDGKTGEILITGKSVAEGYIGEKTGGFIKFQGENAYLTGDIGYKNNEMFYCIGRNDKQIKYKGYRIELSDIEKNINDLEYVEKSVVIAVEKNKGIRIYTFIKTNEIKTILEIKKDLLKKMPEYMCPMIKLIDKIPLTPNGKCDEKKILEEYL